MGNTRLIVTCLCLVMLVVSIHSFWQKSANSPETPDVLYGIPVYPGAKLNLPLSSTGDPAIFVFLSSDSLDQVLAFYDEAFKARSTPLTYGKGAMVIHQYMIQAGELRNYPLKGVEVMAYNSFYRRVLHQRVKIKIYVPEAEVKPSTEPAQDGSTG
jgi:hypothetical protein